MIFYVWDLHHEEATDAWEVMAYDAETAAEDYAELDTDGQVDGQSTWSIMVGDSPEGTWVQYEVYSEPNLSFHAQENSHVQEN